MASRNVSAVVVVVMLIVGALNLVEGLKCKVCTNDEADNCPALPCDLLNDTVSAFEVIAQKHQWGKIAEKVEEAEKERKEFVCVRGLTKRADGKPNFIVSTCTNLNPKFQPRDEPYTIKDYLTSELKENQDIEGVEGISGLVEAFQNMEGEVYVCNERVGNGVNCGENSVVKVSNEETKVEGDGAPGAF